MVWPFSSSKANSARETLQDDPSGSVLAQRETEAAELTENREIPRQMLGDAVRENCAFEAAAFMDCQKSWSLWNRGTLCQASQFKFMECVNAQRVRDSLCQC